MLAGHLKLLMQLIGLSTVVCLLVLLPQMYTRTIETQLEQTQRNQVCIVCKGTERVRCISCFGRGERIAFEGLTWNGSNSSHSSRPSRPPICESCNGSGQSRCPACK